MTRSRRRPGPLLCRLALCLLALAGLYSTMFAGGGFMGTGSLSYYTIQSNLWALGVTLAALALMLLGVAEPDWFKLLRFVLAVAILVTFLVFWTMLAPMMPPAYLPSLSNLSLHTLVPLLLLADTLFCDRGLPPTKKQVLFCVLPPVWYLLFAMVRAEVSDRVFADGSRYPYWFLDVDKLGWFRLWGGVGVFYWVLVVVALVLGLGYLLRWLKARRQVAVTKEG